MLVSTHSTTMNHLGFFVQKLVEKNLYFRYQNVKSHNKGTRVMSNLKVDLTIVLFDSSQILFGQKSQKEAIVHTHV